MAAGNARLVNLAAYFTSPWRSLVIICALALGGLVFIPGVEGPFVFDDQSNIISNDFIKIKTLDWDSLNQAAYSSDAGPLHRPVAMASFALNYYFAGGFGDASPFKLTNLVIHVINGVLVFCFLLLLLRRFAIAQPGKFPGLVHNQNLRTWLAGTVALLWLVHPIQLTSVLYVVQRMVSLAAMFTLLALICYLLGRERLLTSRWRSASLFGAGVVVFGALGALSKEIALLLPLFIVLLEISLFRGNPPLSRWHTLSARKKTVVTVTSLLIILVAMGWALRYTYDGYAVRDFNMGERVLTQARVLWFYISLIIAPRLSDLGLNHDDIIISTSLLSPWTTMPSVVGMIGLIWLAIYLRNRLPLLTLGILWFFAGHAIESSIFPLEMAHEHRNYLPSLGLLLPLIHVADYPVRQTRRGALAFALMAVFAVAFGVVSTLRSGQWSSLHVLARYETLHHPQSARAQAYLATSLSLQGRYEEAMEATRLAAKFDPNDPIYLINLHLLSNRSGIELSSAERLDTVKRLQTAGLTASAFSAIESIGDCISNRCAALSDEYAQWIQLLLNNPNVRTDRSYLYYLLGRSLATQGKTEPALAAFDTASKLDPQYLHPRIEAVQLLIQARQIERAERALVELRTANENNRYPRVAEIVSLASGLDKLRRSKSAAN